MSKTVFCNSALWRGEGHFEKLTAVSNIVYLAASDINWSRCLSLWCLCVRYKWPAAYGSVKKTKFTLLIYLAATSWLALTYFWGCDIDEQTMSAVVKGSTICLKSGIACFQWVQNLLSSSLLSKNMIKIYRTTILPVLTGWKALVSHIGGGTWAECFWE